jgi:tetratricopeptide (TPR) repeat protein
MPYDLFMSYAHRVNARGQVRELRDAISKDFQKFAGRDLSIFFDEHDIPSMTDWEKRIAQGLRESRLFLAVLSPEYFASSYCRREWEEFVRYEAMRQCLGEGVAPVYFVELPGLDGPGVEQSIAAAVDEMRKRQWCDLASQKPVKIIPWHDAGKRALEDAEVARRLNVLKGQMAERLSRADRALQSPTNIYRHNPQFVGRVRELTLLREALNERGSVGVVGHKAQTPVVTAAVHGLGGMGKTELALAYAHAFAWDYPGGRWFARCEGLDNFDLVLHQLAEPLQVIFTEEERNDAHRAAERILAELRRRERSLLLLDNVTHPDLLGPDVLMRLPPQGHVHLLATTRLGPTRLAGSPHDHTFVAVDELPADDGLALIRAHQPDSRFPSAEDESAARELVKLISGYTLAVETAAIYLGRHAAPGTIAAYTKDLRIDVIASSEGFAADPVVAVRRKEKLLERILATTFETLNAEERYILTLAALLPPDTVPWPWLHTLTAMHYTKFEAKSTFSEEAWLENHRRISDLRLLTPGDQPKLGRIHRLVAAQVLRQFIGVEQANEQLNAFVLTIVKRSAIRPAFGFGDNPAADGLFVRFANSDPVLEKSPFEAWEIAALVGYLPNAASTPVGAKNLCLKFPDFYQSIEMRIPLAHQMKLLDAIIHKVRNSSATLDGNQSAILFFTLSFQAKGASFTCDLKRARMLAQEALQLATQESRNWPEEVAWKQAVAATKLQLAEFEFHDGNATTASQLYEECLPDLRPADPPAERSSVAYSNYAAALQQAGDLALGTGNTRAARKYYGELCEVNSVFHQLMPWDAIWKHGYAVTLEKIGDLACVLQDFATGIRSYEACAAIRKEFVESSPTHAGWQQELAVVLQRLGTTLFNTGSAELGLNQLKASVALLEELANHDPANTRLRIDAAGGQFNVAQVSMKLGRTKEAIEIFHVVRSILHELYGTGKLNRNDPAFGILKYLNDRFGYDEDESACSSLVDVWKQTKR